MINADMHSYNYYTFGIDNGYGQQQLSNDIQGSLKIAIYPITTTTTNDIKYKECTYLGLTADKAITDNYVIEHNGTKLKVRYVIPTGRYKQVFMVEL